MHPQSMGNQQQIRVPRITSAALVALDAPALHTRVVC